MSRVIKVDNPGKIRNQLMRTAAELIRRLSQKSTLDDEARDMAATLVYCFRQIDEGIDESAYAWEKRDYWVKAERFRARWGWARRAAEEMETIIREDDWDRLPVTLVDLLPAFSDFKVARFTRDSKLWRGAYRRLMAEDSPD
jgi:hypothetical protein